MGIVYCIFAQLVCCILMIVWYNLPSCLVASFPGDESWHQIWVYNKEAWPWSWCGAAGIFLALWALDRVQCHVWNRWGTPAPSLNWVCFVQVSVEPYHGALAGSHNDPRATVRVNLLVFSFITFGYWLHEKFLEMLYVLRKRKEKVGPEQQHSG